MALYFKPLFSWKEPRAYRDLRKKLRGPQPKWFKPSCALLMCALFLTLGYSSRIMNPPPQSADSISMISLMVIFSFGFVYLGMPLMERVNQTTEIFPDAIRRSNRMLRFKNVASYGWVPVHDFFILVCYSKQGGRFVTAVPSTEVQQRVERILAEKQVARHSTPVALEQLLQVRKPFYAFVLSQLGAVLLFCVILAVGMHILKAQVDLLESYYKKSTKQMLAIKQELKAAHVPREKIKELMHSPEPPFGQMVQTFATAYMALAFLLWGSLVFALTKTMESSARLKPPAVKDPE